MLTAIVSESSLLFLGLFVSIFTILVGWPLTKTIFSYIVLEKERKWSDKGSTQGHQRRGRKMDFFELIVDEIHEIGGANICCGFGLKSNVSLSYSNIHEALACVARRYPLLRTVIVKEPDNEENTAVKFLRVFDQTNMPPIDLKRLDVHDSEWVGIWEEEVERKFNCQKGPLWRTTLLQERYDPLAKKYHNTILFTFYHGTMDGMSVLRFAQEFLSCIEGVTNGTLSLDDERNYERAPIQQGVMKLLASSQPLHYRIMQWFFPLSLLAYVVKFCMRVNMMFDVKNPVTQKFSKSVCTVGQDVRIKLIPRQLSPEKTTKLIKLCRKNRSTVQGAMLACCHLAAARLVQDGRTTGSSINLGWHCPVNVRLQCVPRILEDNLGSYTTLLMENVRVPDIDASNPNNFWKFACQCAHAVHGGIRKGRHLYPLYLLPIAHLLDPKEFVSEFLLHSKMKESEFFSPVHVLTNLGRIDWEKTLDDVYEIENVFGGAGAYRHGPTFINHIATFNGVFTWSTSYVTESITDERARQYVTLVFEILESILATYEDE